MSDSEYVTRDQYQRVLQRVLRRLTTMTTTTEKLLKMAEDHEEKAAALRLSATLLNGHATLRKQAAGIEAPLKAAAALRRTQRTQRAERAKKPTRYAQRKESRAARDRKWYTVALILKGAGKPLTIDELSAAAKEQGISGLTGIQSSVYRGWIARKGKRYVYKQLPPLPDTAATAAD